MLVFTCALVVLVGVARLLGALASRVGVPAVVGELVAGLLLGPSVLGNVAPDARQWLFPDEAVSTSMLFAVAWLGVLFLLFATGAETDLHLIRRFGRAAASVGAGSLLVPLALGLALGAAMPAVFVGPNADGATFPLFMATALSISALPVIAKVLRELGLMRRNVGQLTLAVGMSNDVVGWILLGVVAGLAKADSGAGSDPVASTAVALTGLVAFVAVAFTVGQRILDASLHRLRRGGAEPAVGVTVLAVVALGSGAVTQWIGVEAVLGAFIAGVVVGRSPLRDERHLAPIETVTNAVLAPLFFATAGLRVDLGLLGDPEVLAWAVAAIVVASGAKVLGAFIGASVAGLPRREGFALGAALNARGALEIVVASVGLSVGVLTDSSYTVVVLLAIVTSLAAPPALRLILDDWEGTPEERERLEGEQALDDNVLVRAERLLLPSRGGPASIMAGQVLDLVWPTSVGVSVLTAGDGTTVATVQPVLDVFGDRPHEHLSVMATEPASAVVREAEVAYGAIGLGARYGRQRGSLVSPTVDEVLVRATIPVVLVRRGRDVVGPLPWAYGRAVVAVDGTRPARAAMEVGLNLSARLGTVVHVTHVVTREASELRHTPDEATPPAVPPGVGALLDEAEARARSVDARFEITVRRGISPAAELLALSDEVEADLVIVGAEQRSVDTTPFLGHVVEELLDSCPATLVVVSFPPST